MDNPHSQLMKDFNFGDGFELTEEFLEEFYKSTLFEYLSQHWKISTDSYKKLYPFQLRGLEFLFTNYAKKRHSIIDYDPGMGKTVLICVFFDILARTLNKVQILIVCERNSVDHWYHHFNVWTDTTDIDLLTVRITAISQEIELKKCMRSDKIVLIVEPKKLEDFIINSNWDFIVIDNFHSKEISSNRNVKTLSGNKIKNSTLILLTNYVIRKPSHRPVLWEMLHFLDNKLVSSKKDFTSKCLCALQDRLWFPWKDLYLRMGWAAYPGYQEKMNTTLAESKTNKRYQISDFEIINKFKETNKLEITDKSRLEIVEIDKKSVKTINIENQTNNPINEITLMQDNTINGICETQPIKIPSIVQKQACSSNAPGGSYFIEVNNEYLTPRCFQMRTYLTNGELVGANLNDLVINLTEQLNSSSTKLILEELNALGRINFEDGFTQNYIDESLSVSSKADVKNINTVNDSYISKSFQKESNAVSNTKNELISYSTSISNSVTTPNVSNSFKKENIKNKPISSLTPNSKNDYLILHTKNESQPFSIQNFKSPIKNLDNSNSLRNENSNIALHTKNETISCTSPSFNSPVQKENSISSLGTIIEPISSSTPNSNKTKHNSDWNDIFENLISPKKSRKDEGSSKIQTVLNNRDTSISEYLDGVNKSKDIPLSTKLKDKSQENVSIENKADNSNYLSQLFDKLVPPGSSFRIIGLSGKNSNLNSETGNKPKVCDKIESKNDRTNISHEKKSKPVIEEDDDFCKIFNNIIKKK